MNGEQAWVQSRTDYAVGAANPSARSTRLLAAATIYGVRHQRNLPISYQQCAEAVRGLELALWVEDHKGAPDGSYVAQDLAPADDDNESLRQSRMRLEEIAEAARGLTPQRVLDGGGVVIGPQGWERLVETLARLYEYRMDRPLTTSIGKYPVLLANDRVLAEESDAWKYKILGPGNATWSVGYDTFEEALAAAHRDVLDNG